MGKVKIIISETYKYNPAVVRFTKQLPDFFETQGKVLYNERNVIKSYKLESSDTLLSEVVVKRYKRPGLFQRIIYGFFRSTKAKRAFYNACELRKRKIETPHEIAFIEQKKGGLLEYGFYISGSDYGPPIRNELIEPENFNRNMAKAFAAFAAELHGKGILHHDLNSTNTLYHKTGNAHYSFSLIDINRMKFLSRGQHPSVKECLNNLTRFTGRMDLFEYVMQWYCNIRNLDDQTFQQAIQMKKKHDEQWRRRKAFLRIFKTKKNE